MFSVDQRIFNTSAKKVWRKIVDFQVAFVAIGATMVGSIRFLKKEGDYVGKGDPVFI